MNAYRVYEVMYDEEKAKKTPWLPPRHTHTRFLEELVYDFIFPGQSKSKINVVIDAKLVSNLATEEALSICSFSVLGQQDHGEDKGVHDLTSSSGQKEYLQGVPAVRITQCALEEGKFWHCLNGMRHNWIPAKTADHCQWCYYQLINVFSEEDSGISPKA